MNEQFLERMQSCIPNEMEAFQKSLEQPLYQGLRSNPLKTDAGFLKEHLPFLQKDSPFYPDTWYIQGSYGLHPYHLQGRFYLQEPSAGCAVSALQLQDGQTVLDLCAAPGSKSTQIAGLIPNGFLVSNEIEPKRAQVLLSNMERMGVENMMVTNMDSKTLCSQLPEAFDAILVDAPCSGEGMMKKHAAAKDEWSLDNVLLCAARQKEILQEAWKALKPGGRLVYSTCTYAREENEDNAAWLLQTFSDARQADIPGEWGRPGLKTEGLDVSKVRRVFPMDGGEGHFVAAFEKAGDLQEGTALVKEEKPAKMDPAAAAFLREQMREPYPFLYTVPGKDKVQVFGMHHPFWKLKKGKVLRQGVYIGDVIKKRFEPAHAFYLAASMQDTPVQTEVSLKEMDDFVHGLQLNKAQPRGWRALSYEGIPFAFGKSDGTRISNKYPKGLRLNPDSHVLDLKAQADSDLKTCIAADEPKKTDEPGQPKDHQEGWLE